MKYPGAVPRPVHMESGLFNVCLIGVKDTETEELSVSSVTLPDDLQCVMSVKGEMALWKITEEFRRSGNRENYCAFETLWS